jgi:cell division protein FtsB
MGLFKPKTDPITDRSRALNQEIAALENQIRQLNSQIEKVQSQPRLRSTALPNQPSAPAPLAETLSRDPIFEPVTSQTPRHPDSETTPGHYNDLGVRKYDLLAAWSRLQSHFRGPPASNPKLVSYLAAGSIKGLRPLRYEKRVARNRFLALFIVLLLLLWGVVAMFFGNR